ncbi:response regulator [Streptomyces sp. C10-9-1]|uniref:response regulator n=1 Tax=Streptomyces sp. C10-9-1 TaxID=1859285 RepID=UPI003D748513
MGPGGVGPVHLCAPGAPSRPPQGAEVGKTRTRPRPRTYSRVVSGAPRRVLVVDDNRVIRQLIRVNLELEGFEVVTAADGAECLEVVHQVRPDAVTLDVVMPRLDGLRTAARLRADPRTARLPLAIISACTPYEVESGLAAGVDAFLAKPFEPAELVRVVRRLVREPEGSEDEADGGSGDRPGGLDREEPPLPVPPHPAAQGGPGAVPDRTGAGGRSLG